MGLGMLREDSEGYLDAARAVARAQNCAASAPPVERGRSPQTGEFVYRRAVS